MVVVELRVVLVPPARTLPRHWTATLTDEVRVVVRFDEQLPGREGSESKAVDEEWEGVVGRVFDHRQPIWGCLQNIPRSTGLDSARGRLVLQRMRCGTGSGEAAVHHAAPSRHVSWRRTASHTYDHCRQRCLRDGAHGACRASCSCW